MNTEKVESIKASLVPVISRIKALEAERKEILLAPAPEGDALWAWAAYTDDLNSNLRSQIKILEKIVEDTVCQGVTDAEYEILARWLDSLGI